MKKTLVTIVSAIALLVLASVAMAAGTATIQVQASIPTSNALNVSINKIVGSVWTPATVVDFGALVLDPAFGVFRPSDGGYYVVDVGVNSNAPAWTVTHTVTPMTNGTANLDNKINVTFMNQGATTGTELAKLSYAASNSRVIANTDLSAGSWLRIYYGIAGGSGDATGVTPITTSQPGGSYAGTITLTLAP